MIEHIAEADFPTKFGRFRVHAFRDSDKKEHLVLEGKRADEPIFVRIHSKCTTGDVFHSLRCDCRQQLETSLKKIGKQGGLLIYLDQEGRGIGLGNKIISYSLQDNGRDTFEANVELGFPGDGRDYKVASEILKYFNVKHAKVLTNNPNKVKELQLGGINVTIIPLRIKPNCYNKKYLETKKRKMGHL